MAGCAWATPRRIDRIGRVLVVVGGGVGGPAHNRQVFLDVNFWTLSSTYMISRAPLRCIVSNLFLYLVQGRINLLCDRKKKTIQHIQTLHNPPALGPILQLHLDLLLAKAWPPRSHFIFSFCLRKHEVPQFWSPISPRAHQISTLTIHRGKRRPLSKLKWTLRQVIATPRTNLRIISTEQCYYWEKKFGACKRD